MLVSIPIFTSPASAAKVTANSGSFVQGVIVSLPTNWVLQFLFFLSTSALFSFPPLVFRFLFLFLVSVSRFSFPVSRFPFPVSVSRFRSYFPFPPLFLSLSPVSDSRSRFCLLPSPAASRFSLLFSASPIPRPSWSAGVFSR